MTEYRSFNDGAVRWSVNAKRMLGRVAGSELDPNIRHAQFRLGRFIRVMDDPRVTYLTTEQEFIDMINDDLYLFGVLAECRRTSWAEGDNPITLRQQVRDAFNLNI